MTAGKLVAFILASCLLTLPAMADHLELRFGSVAMDIPAVMHKRLKPLSDYLADELRRPVTLRLSPTLSDAMAEVASGTVHIAYLTPVAYVRAYERGRVRLVAKTVTNGETTFKLMIVTREDSGIRSLSDLGKADFAFGDPAAILQQAVVVGAGLRLARFGSYRFLGHYDNIVRGVLNGDFDAGIVKDTTAYAWAGRGLRILYASPELPPYNVAVNKSLDEPSYNAIKQALLRLDRNNPEHRKVLDALDPNYDGFAPASDAEYDVVRRLIRPFGS